MTKYNLEIICNGCGYGAGNCFCAIDWTKAEVTSFPSCNFCRQLADFDAKITLPAYKGIWSYMCRLHWEDMTNQQLGLGKGQKLVLVEGAK